MPEQKMAHLQQVDARELDAQPLLLLLDCARIAPILPKLYQLQDSPEWGYLYQHTDYEDLATVGALWVETTADSALFKHWYSDPLWSSSGIALQSQAPLEQQLAHLRSLIKVNSSTTEEDWALLRFWSPGVQSYLMPALTEQEQQQFLGCFSALYWATPEAGTLMMAENSLGTLLTQHQQPWWQLTPAQQQALKEYEG